MRKGLIYIHGKGGTAGEAGHYSTLFPEYDVTGLDYSADTPWEAETEFSAFFDAFQREHGEVSIVANSIGAFYAMNALSDKTIEKAYFISPVVNMEKLIRDMMQWAGVSETELRAAGKIETTFGETLSWEYLTWVRTHPFTWRLPTAILYGERDHLQSPETVRAFASGAGASLTVMPGGEHWFHTEEQMAFLDQWILREKA